MRARWICVWFVLGLSSVLGLYFVDAFRTRFPLGLTETSALTLTGPGTLASWWSTVCLLACGVMAAMIYTIRSHRVDDYRGRYRQWRHIAVLCALASVTVAAPVHRILQAAAVQLTGQTLWGDGALWWMLPGYLTGALVGIRALLDMRPARMPRLWLGLAAAAYLAAGLGHLQVIEVVTPWTPLVMLGGHYSLFWSLCLFARYIYLDAQGLVAEPKRRVRRTGKSAKLRGAGSPAEEVDAEHDSRPKRSDRKDPKRKPSPDESLNHESPDEDLPLDELELLTDPDLTRAERRKLRKKLKRQRRAA